MNGHFKKYQNMDEIKINNPKIKSVDFKTIQDQKLVILMPMVWSIRNYIHSGILDQLVNIDLYLLINHYDTSFDKSIGGINIPQSASCQSLILPPVKRRIKGLALLKQVIGCAFSRRNHIGSYDIYRRWFHRYDSIIIHLRNMVIEILGFIAQPAPVFFSLYNLYNWLYRSEYDLSSIKDQLRKINPAAILSTVNVEDQFERAYILSAHELGIPVITSIVSFDNLTSKPAHLIYDHYLVWNHGMKDQLLRFYPQVKPDQVSITGTSQFDFHIKPEFLWSREFTLRHLGLPSTAKYFLYGASPRTLTPAEPELVAKLAKMIQASECMHDYWLVVRVHPRDDWSRWEKARLSTDHVLLSYAWCNTPDNSGWAIPTMDDHARLTSSLAYTSACINIASTITFDAAILDKPVIGICFDHEPDAPKEILYEEYNTDHYRPLVESGGLRLAHSWSELQSLMRQAIESPEIDRENRASMVAQECGMVDGKAVERVTATLLTYLNQLIASPDG